MYFKEVNTGDNAFVAGDEFEIVSMGTSNGNTGTANSDAAAILNGTSITGSNFRGRNKSLLLMLMHHCRTISRVKCSNEGMTFRRSSDTLDQGH